MSIDTGGEAAHEAALEHELNQRADQEMQRLGLHELSFSAETLRQDWEKLLDYYGPETLPHALSIYGVEETLREYAPQRSPGSVLRSEVQTWPSQLRRPNDGRGKYEVPFSVPLEWTAGDTPFHSLFGEDYAEKYRGGKLCGGFQSDSDPRFVWGDELTKLQQELRERVLTNVAAEQKRQWGQTAGRAFLGYIRERIKASLQTELKYPSEQVQSWNAQRKELRDQYREQLGQIFNP